MNYTDQIKKGDFINPLLAYSRMKTQREKLELTKHDDLLDVVYLSTELLDLYEDVVNSIEAKEYFSNEGKMEIAQQIKSKLHTPARKFFIKVLSILSDDEFKDNIGYFFNSFLNRSNLSDLFGFSDIIKSTLVYSNYALNQMQMVRDNRNVLFSFKEFIPDGPFKRLSNECLIMNKSMVFDIILRLKAMHSKNDSMNVDKLIFALSLFMAFNDMSEDLETFKFITNYE